MGQDRGFRSSRYRSKRTDMADPNANFLDVLRRNVRDSVHRVLKRLSGQGRKRKKGKGGEQPSRVKKKNIKRDMFPLTPSFKTQAWQKKHCR